MGKRQHPDEYEESRNYVVDELALNGGLWPVRMGRLKAGPNYRFPQRMIDYYALHFVINGKVRHRFGDQHIELTKGDVFCAYPGVVYHHFIVQSDQPLEMIWVSIDGGQTALLLEKAGFRPAAPYIPGVIGKELETSLVHLFSQQEDNSSRRQVDLIAAIYRIFGLMIPQKNTDEPDVGPASWIPRSIEYMNMHYTENINVQDVAAYISVHRAYFSKIFAEQIGMTPIQYLQKLRMERALQLLQQTRHSISEIAMTLGYPDLYSFSRAFGKHYAASPSKVRENAKSGGLLFHPD
ncbi:AraC family transcriptional regulator [Paenibacillus chondroitinus]|uniref:AraC family transcriptional regulator n=1 Tax=Paenibacillus chondroitinus TaxID=59842 RepID=A0ABU6DAE5_9BACL|nr:MULTISPECIES: AraC family transcriptional regulator [Paenibacillus]MCY9662279.1 AraC family transcriptional regulator [Paenibacillus anseongense]MEB4794683.1 AraC family transcriptional regulator [Paenibacillus chondroitinus]